MIDKRPAYKGSCHCQAVQFNVRLTDELNTARRCTCSMCSRRGAVAVSAELKDIEFISGKDSLSCYSFGTGVAKHYFCGTCGVFIPIIKGGLIPHNLVLMWPALRDTRPSLTRCPSWMVKTTPATKKTARGKTEPIKG